MSTEYAILSALILLISALMLFYYDERLGFFCFFNHDDLINNNYIFSGLNSKDVCDLIKSSEHKIRTWEKDDIILKIEGRRIRTFEDLRLIFKNLKIGDSVELKIERNKKTLTLTLPYDEKLLVGCKQLVPFHRFADTEFARYYSDLQAQTAKAKLEEIPLPAPPIIIGDRMALYYGTLGETLSPGLQSKLHLATAVAVRETGSIEQRYEAREKSFHVAALFHSRFYEDDRRKIYLPLKEALRFLDGAQVELFIGVKLAGDKYNDTEAYRNLLITALEEQLYRNQPIALLHNIRSWKQEKAVLLQAVDREEALLTIILSFIIIYAGIMIVIIIIVTNGIYVV